LCKLSALNESGFPQHNSVILLYRYKQIINIKKPPLKEKRIMSRRKIIAGNWKMNKTPSEAVALVNELKPLVANDEVDVVFCVPAISIIPCLEAAKGTNINIGAENMYFEESGAFTGEIAPNMLTDVGVKYVIIGHSERREYFAESDITVNQKVKKAFEHSITPIICCGESLEQREQGVTIDFIRQQIKIAFLDVTADQAKTAVIAYEPIWAIGTGKVATTEQAQEVCAAIRVCIGEIYDEATAASIRIQYGGSVTAASAAELFSQPDIDGGLVGGASLKPDFGKIVNYK
jgi:triosephosphate isomerase